MFPSKSSSDINSKTNAFKNNFKENVFGNNVPERLEGPATVAKLSNEVALRPSPLSQSSSIFPSDQVPDYGATHALVDVLATAVDGLAVTTKMTMTNGSEAAEVMAVAVKSKKVMVAAAGQQEEELGRGRADPPKDLPLPMAKLSTSVISSSNCGTEEHPSPETSHRAQQGFNAMFASHLGSSNSLFSSSQSHTISFSTHSNTTSTINSTTNITFKDMAPTHISQSIRHPNIILSKKEKDEKENVPKDDSLKGLKNPNFTNETVLYQENKMKKINDIPMKGPATNARWGIPPGLGLCGGGESSLTSGATTWGPAPTAATSGPPGSSGSGNNASSSGNPGSTGNSNANSSSNNNSTTTPSNTWGGGGVGSASAVTQNASQWGSSNNNNNNRPGNNGNGNASTTAGQQSAGSSQGQGGLTNQGGSTVPAASSQTNPQGNSGTIQSNVSTAPGPASTSWAQAAGKNLPGGPSSSGGLGNNAPPGNGQNTGVNTVGGAGNVPGGSNGSSSTSSAPGSSTKQQLEQLNTMREALFSQDGWGGQYVNQDTGWDIPNSPEPGLKDSGTGGTGGPGGAGAGGGLPAWKPNVNNGTDLWEANLRNGGQPPPAQAQKTPWGHTPTTNIGGTWGEDDDVSDSSNVWTGVPSGQQGTGGGGGAGGGGGPGSQWGGGGGPPQQTPMWGGPKKENDWPGPGGGPVPGGSSAGVSATGGPAGAAGSSWATSAGAGGATGSLDPRPDPRELRGTGLMDPRDHMRGVVDPRDLRDLRAMNNNEATSAAVAAATAAALMRGDTRGISGRLNGANTVDPATAAATAAAAAAAAGMWGHPQQSSHHHAGGGHQPPGQGKMPGMPGATSAGVNQWVPPPPKDLGLTGGGSKPSGWEEPSPPVQRRNIPNYDDGTSLWGNPAQQSGRMAGKVSHWKEMPTPNMGRGGSGGGGGMQCPPGIQQGRMPSGGNGQTIKQDNAPPLWSHLGDMRMLVSANSRNGSWTDGSHDNVGNSGWGDDGKVVPGGGINSWNDPSLGSGPNTGGGGASSWGGGGGNITGTGPGGPKQKNQLNPGWVDGDMDVHAWVQPPKQGPKPLNKDLIWASKQFRILVEMGYKKEDVENALRSSNMTLEDAIEQLNNRFGIDSWRRQDDQFDMAAVAAAGAGHHPAAAAAAAAAAGGFAGRGGYNPVAQPMPFAPPPPNQGQSAGGFNQGQRSAQNQPSTAQLRMLVQQIQMAVQAGYLNHQILNQPLAPQTLVLLNQLLQQIKVLQELMQRQTLLQVQSHKNTPTPNAVLHISVQITKTKQQIQNLQNQIASQQAIFVKLQHQQQQHHLAATQGHQQATGDFFKPNMHDPLSNFADLSINKEPPNAFQGSSRLPQWKLPAVDKEGIGEIGSDFSRAPGSAKPPGNSGLPQSHASPNMNPLLGPGDGTWSTVTRSNSDTGWPDTTSSSNNDVSVPGEPKDPWPSSVGQVNSSASANFTDLVPEFEPGKPWKGNHIIKSIEDDPSITPGSVVRSPLSLANLKDSEIFNPGSKTSPTVSAVDPIAPMSLSSNTWSFNPPASSSSVFTSPLSKMGSKGMSMWSEAPQPTPVTSELWGAPMNKPRGPPPGLAGKGATAAAVAAAAAAAAAAGGSNASNGWGVLTGGGIRGGGSSSSGGGPWSGMQQGGGNIPGRGWLLLKNLTPQIDGSTLKTLCLQHGPLDSFHLYLNHGIALALYSSREEANKAQSALNNCVLSNTTIFTESPGDSEVHSLLHHLGLAPSAQQSQQVPNQPQGTGIQQGWGRGPSAAVAAAVAAAAAAAAKGNGSQAPPTSNTDTWTSNSGGAGAAGSSQLWPQTTSTASALWGSGGLVDGGGSNSNAVDQHRATPSSLNSFLPGDLLGGESM